jgi:hypothetical protein
MELQQAESEVKARTEGSGMERQKQQRMETKLQPLIEHMAKTAKDNDQYPMMKAGTGRLFFQLLQGR